MKIGLFADIHGNIYAFNKVWEALRKESCDEYIFAGDICGYYYYQNDCIEILKGIKNLTAIRGNHDQIFLDMLDNKKLEEEYGAKYGKSSSLLRKSITKDNLDFLKGLPDKHIIDGLGIGVFHGSPWNYLEEYIYPDDPLNRFENVPYKFIILGHTHRPMDKNAGTRRVINPGSCGQPRDHNQPSFATIDTDTGNVIIKRVRYDTGPMIKDILIRKEENMYLVDVLKRE